MKTKIPKRQLQKYAQQLVHGTFGSLIQELDLLHVLPYNMYRKREQHARATADPIALVRVLSELGPGFVEAGRILGSRGDIIPQQFQRQLLTFTYAPKPLKVRERNHLLHSAWGKPIDDVVSHLEEEPIYNTLLGHTYSGILHDGKRVLITVHEPDVVQEYQQNIEVLSWIHTWYTQRKEGFDVTLFENIEAELVRRKEQLSDLTHVASRIEILASHYEAEDYIKTPEVVWQYTTPHVLVYRTHKATSLAQVRHEKLHHAKKTSLIKKLVSAFLIQYGKAGVCMLRPTLADFGFHEEQNLVCNHILSTSILEPHERALFVELLCAIVKNDSERATKALLAEHYRVHGGVHHASRGMLPPVVEGNVSEQLWGYIEAAWQGGIHVPVGITMAAESFSYVEHMLLRLSPKLDMHKTLKTNLSSVLKKR